MGRTQLVLADDLAFSEIDAHHKDSIDSFQLYFSPNSPAYTIRFLGESHASVQIQLNQRIQETETRSIFALLTSLEATFRIDFDSRCRRRLKDDLSRFFRATERKRGDAVRLDQDILEGWKQHSSASPQLIGQLRGAFKLRHWIAHGRYWAPKLGQTYTFNMVATMTSAILQTFPFEA